MRVDWTETAIDHLSSIHDYVAQNLPTYARRVVDRLTRRSQQIAQFSYLGRAVPELELPQVREVPEGSYRIDVLAVIHGAQQMPWGR